jgi:hypothetical protein
MVQYAYAHKTFLEDHPLKLFGHDTADTEPVPKRDLPPAGTLIETHKRAYDIFHVRVDHVAEPHRSTFFQRFILQSIIIVRPDPEHSAQHTTCTTNTRFANMPGDPTMNTHVHCWGYVFKDIHIQTPTNICNIHCA